MTEAEWLACAQPRWMLEHLGRKARTRKLRLFACACVRRAWHRITNPVCRQAVEIAERFADREARNKEREQAAWAVRALCGPGIGGDITAAYHAARGTRFTFNDAIIASAHAVFAATGVRQVGDDKAAEDAERAAQAELLRDIYGNPFHPPALDGIWLTWNGGTIPALAQSIYQERAFVRMPLLGDALEDAGCTDPAILEHCRGPGPHVRGCWVIDLLLGKQ